ncbi:polyunsaturated fatty acid 5-lipoxygenase-like [Saccostrea echinata]|uniref:polyunsaturated fatty acid 5-lipoxygenase-like n=1 Tax=Saccostrea echinata TaxID=191078 RepID=UPI002A7F2E06|nr:polyunsaturated fatty acid 5-lipoxygenase-like [Saccostrea echinata]
MFTGQQVSGSTGQQVDRSASRQVSRLVNKCAQVNKSAGRQVSRSTGQQVDRLAARQYFINPYGRKEFHGLLLTDKVKNVPDDEEFSFCHKFDLLKKTLILKAGKTWEMIFGDGPWQTLDELKDIYSKIFEEPKGMQGWDSDISFGWQRLNGLNPNMIRLCSHLPDKFGVTEEMIKPFLEGLTISQAIRDKRLFITDLEVMNGISLKEGCACPAPIALFFVDARGQLMPVAIQLFQQKSRDNPVFLPSDPPYTWLMAKMWFNVGDSNLHQTIVHLGCTHLILESVCVAGNRCLSPSHPMFKLLAPHFLYIIAINK